MSIMVNSFHDQEREEGASALSFFFQHGLRPFLKSQRIAKRPLRFLCDLPKFFLKPQSCSEAKVTEIRRAITSLFL